MTETSPNQQQPTSPSIESSSQQSETNKEINQSAILTPSRTAYLPLVSPSIEEEGRNLKRSRDDDKGESASYFNIKTDTSSSAIDTDEEEGEDAETASIPTAKRARIPLVSLPDEIGHPLMRAIEQSMNADQSNIKIGESSASTTTSQTTTTRQHRAMSVPRNLRSKIHPVTALMVANRRPSSSSTTSSTTNNQTSTSNDPISERQRRNSVRAQQLSLLASQARLALSGTSNVNTAIRTENAVKGAVIKAFNDVQARKQRESISNLNPSSPLQSERGEDIVSPIRENNIPAEQNASPSSRIDTAIRDPTATWSEALQNAKTATSFLDSAKEVARDWANGFYAYEKEWIGSALQKEQSKIIEEEGEEVHSRNEIGRRTSLSAPPTSAKEEESTITDKDMVIPVEPTKGGGGSNDSISNYTIGQKVVDSNLIPTRRSIEFSNGGGKLVDVLSNFATLIDSHKEGCHSLEKLAQNARRLSAVQLPNVRFDNSATSTATTTIGSMSAVSSDAGSPMSVTAGVMS